jgi:hypothetical protein
MLLRAHSIGDPVQRFAIAVLLSSALLAACRPAHAFPHVTVTACDTVRTSPLQVRTTFTVDIPGPAGPWYAMLVESQPGTQLLGCEGAPTGWSCDWQPVGYPTPATNFYSPGRYFETNDHLEGFAILANRAAPCIYLTFYGSLLLKGGDRVEGLDGSYFIAGCLAKDAPTPAQGTSWGSVKFLYR